MDNNIDHEHTMSYGVNVFFWSSAEFGPVEYRIVLCNTLALGLDVLATVLQTFFVVRAG